MSRSKYFKIVVLLPIIGFLLMILKAEIDQTKGDILIVPIKGVDPRDILRGHYLIYSFAWNFDQERTNKFPSLGESELCLVKTNNGLIAYPIVLKSLEDCHYRIKGKFSKLSETNFNYSIGIEKFFIPEEHASKLEHLLISSEAKIKFRINKDSKPVLLDLLINGKSWEEQIK